MTFPYSLAFLSLLAAYMIYSVWAGLDPRILVGGALALLVGAAVAEAAGSAGTANTLAEYVFFLLAGGVVLLLVDHLRDDAGSTPAGRSSGGAVPADGPAPEPTQSGHRPAQDALDRPEQ